MLKRLERSALAPRIELLPEELDHEPPRRTWVFRVRPTRAGNDVLPPVAIAAFDPDIERYITKVTQGIPVKVVAAPSLDLTTFQYTAPDLGTDRRYVMTIAFAAYISALMVASGLALVVRSRQRPSEPIGPRAARQFARRFARRLAFQTSTGLHRRQDQGGRTHHHRRPDFLCATRDGTAAGSHHTRRGRAGRAGNRGLATSLRRTPRRYSSDATGSCFRSEKTETRLI